MAWTSYISIFSNNFNHLSTEFSLKINSPDEEISRIMTPLSLISSERNRREDTIGKKKKEEQQKTRVIKYRRTIEGKWNLKGCHRFWSYFPVPSRSKRSFHGISFFFLLLTIIEKRDTSAREREKKNERKKRGHVAVNFHIHHCRIRVSF